MEWVAVNLFDCLADSGFSLELGLQIGECFVLTAFQHQIKFVIQIDPQHNVGSSALFGLAASNVIQVRLRRNFILMAHQNKLIAFRFLA